MGAANEDKSRAKHRALQILGGFVGDRVERLRGTREPEEALLAIGAAHTDFYGEEAAGSIARDLCEWREHAAFVCALHLFPERFAENVIEEGVLDFLFHAAHQVAEAAMLLGFPVEDIFKEETDCGECAHLQSHDWALLDDIEEQMQRLEAHDLQDDGAADGFQKALDILGEIFPEHASRLRGTADDCMDAMQRSMTPGFGPEAAAEIAFHMGDWNSDVAFIVALHLYPDRFTGSEIEDGVTSFLIHAPNHIAQAAELAGYPIDDALKKQDQNRGSL